MACSPLIPRAKGKGSPPNSFAAVFPVRGAVATLRCPTDSRGPPQSLPTSPPRRNGVPRPGDVLPASSPPPGGPAARLRIPPRSGRATARRIAPGQGRRMRRKASRRSGIAVLSGTGAAGCRRAKGRTRNDHRNAPRIATLRPASLAQDPRPSDGPCQGPAHSARGRGVPPGEPLEGTRLASLGTVDQLVFVVFFCVHRTYNSPLAAERFTLRRHFLRIRAESII